jgi:biopolymer transport protein ExbD
MRGRNHNEEEEGHGIDLAPMLDFVLNLLIFFIIITSFIKQPGVKVTKPEAVTAESKANGNIIIAIRPNGDVWMDRKKVNLPDVRAMVERMHAERPEDTVIIAADKDSQSGMVTKIMDEVRGGGIQTVSIGALGQE